MITAQGTELYLQSSHKLFYYSSFFFPFFLSFLKIFYWLIVRQIEAFQRSGIQVENGNLERLFIMRRSHDYNHQLEFH